MVGHHRSITVMIPFTMKRRRDSIHVIRFSYSTIWAGLILLAILSVLHSHRLSERIVLGGLNISQDGTGHRLSTGAIEPLTDVSNSNGTIVVQLAGEMGNNLHKLAFGRGLQLMAKNNYNLDLHLVLRHQNHPKWLSAKLNLQKCFPNLRNFDFSAGNSKEYADRQIEQKLWLATTPFPSDDLVLQGNDETSMGRVLKQIQSILEFKSSNSLPPTRDSSSQSKIQLPFLVADDMVDWYLLDRYRAELLEWLVFDYDACCPSSLPEPDESIFHFRNFVTELQGATSSLGFDELSAQRTATDLFGHLHAGDKVAITTRFDNDVTEKYIRAMEERGLQVRVISGNSATKDFCFLAKSKKELIGGQRSSFFTWAAYLGTALGAEISSNTSTTKMEQGIQRVRSYTVNPPGKHQASGRNSMQLPYEWKDEWLKEKWTFEVFQTLP